MTFLSQLDWRYATKKFNGVKIPDADIQKITDAIIKAPTSFGLQPFHVTVVSSEELKSKLKEKAYNQEQITSGSHVFIFSARTDVVDRVKKYFDTASGDDANTRQTMKDYEAMVNGFAAGLSEEGVKVWAAKQVYIALGFGLAACAELGIDSCPMEGFDPAGFKEVLGLPENHFPVVTLATGYRDASEVIRSKVRFSETDLFDTK